MSKGVIGSGGVLLLDGNSVFNFVDAEIVSPDEDSFHNFFFHQAVT